ncbi:ASTRA complex subunit [Emmonsiellopsis sp. PD_33]|nr:ASTRA complex subunit [Emmonsiellopsis sp. PD_33]
MSTHHELQNPFSVLSQPDQQPAKLPPATPVFVLRGHASPIHALHFYSKNSRLISGDGDGWVIVWNMTTKRAVAVWKAHESAVLDVRGLTFGSDGERDGNSEERWVFTHGRDHKLRVWRLNASDEESLSKDLPVDGLTSAKQRNEPWLFHSLAVNALNFCAFALCRVFPSIHQAPNTQSPELKDQGAPQPPVFFLAVPNALNTGGVDIFHLPSEKRVSTISPDPSVNTGMVMALELFRTPDGTLCLISGYEDGRAMIHVQRGPGPSEYTISPGTTNNPPTWTWERVYLNHPHSQPVLSLAVSPSPNSSNPTYFITSSADAIISKHPVISKSPAHPTKAEDLRPLKVVNSKHAGQQGLRIRNDGKIFATAGWDHRVRVYSCKTMRELAVLKWHKEGCYAVAFAEVDSNGEASAAGGKSTETDNADTAGEARISNPDKDTRKSTSLSQQLPPLGPLAAIKQRRGEKAQFTHWLAAGAKDGKISLWDIY